MSAAFRARRVAAIIAKQGRAMTLRRAGESDLAVRGVRQEGASIEAGNTATQQVFKVRITPTELLASSWASKVPASSGDVLVVEGRIRTVIEVEPIHDGDVLAMYDLTVAG